MANKPFFRRRKVCPFSGDNAPAIDYKDTRLLAALRVRAWQDRAVADHRGVGERSSANWRSAIKRARFLALLPYAVK